MKQNKQMYEAPKVELIEMETQGVLCSSGPEVPPETAFNGNVMNFNRKNGSWAAPN
jgi:hypothetical protein